LLFFTRLDSNAIPPRAGAQPGHDDAAHGAFDAGHWRLKIEGVAIFERERRAVLRVKADFVGADRLRGKAGERLAGPVAIGAVAGALAWRRHRSWGARLGGLIGFGLGLLGWAHFTDNL
jgi:hypothetical protein